MSWPTFYYRFALFLLVASLLGWPITQATVFRDEPPGILGLSWFAIVLTAVDIVATSKVHKKQEEE